MRKRTVEGKFQATPVYYLLWQKPVFSFTVIAVTIAIIWALGQFEFGMLPAIKAKPQDAPIADFDRGYLKVEAVNQLKSGSVDRCAEAIDRMLDRYGKTAFNGRGQVFVDAVKATASKVKPSASRSDLCKSAKWAVAIGLTESGGRHESGKFNYWGLKDFRTGKWEDFASIDNAINTYVHRTYRPYLQHNSHSAYKNKYCQSACTKWETNVNYFLGLMK